MPKVSKIKIFNVMTEEELDKELKNTDSTRREYQRLVAMKAISIGLSHKDVAKILGVSYESVYRWATSCSEKGMSGLKPNFNGGRPSKLTMRQKFEFANMIYLSDEELSITQAKQMLKKEFGVEYSLMQVSNIISDLGFVYTTARPKYLEADEDREKILRDRIEEANITNDDILIGLDESTMKTGNKIKKAIRLKSDKKNVKK